MLSKCANPECSAPFDYRHGRLFRLPVSLNHASVQHFWLCENCAETFTLHQSDGLKPAIRRRLHSAVSRTARMTDAA